VHRRIGIDVSVAGLVLPCRDVEQFAGTGNGSASRSANHAFAATPWHLGQWRLRQELQAMWVWSHFSQYATWPPSAAVRQRSIADITFSCPRLR